MYKIYEIDNKHSKIIENLLCCEIVFMNQLNFEIGKFLQFALDVSTRIFCWLKCSAGDHFLIRFQFNRERKKKH